MRVAIGARARPEGLGLAWALVSAVVLLVARVVPFEAHPIVLCPLRLATHVPCPACGMTRAFARVAHGELGRAFEVSPLGCLLAISAVVLVGWTMLRWVRLVPALQIELAPAEQHRAARVAVALVLVNWAYLVASGAPLRG